MYIYIYIYINGIYICIPFSLVEHRFQTEREASSSPETRSASGRQLFINIHL